MEYRFAIGAPESKRSGSWKLWSRNNELYLKRRSKNYIDKFSFHSSGICRWAAIDDLGDGRNRLFRKWNRKPIPSSAESGAASLLLALTFPTNHLGTDIDDLPGKVHWLEPAPTNMASLVEIFLTRMPENEIRRHCTKSEIRSLLRCSRLPNGLWVGVTKVDFPCGPVQLKIPRDPPVPGQIFGDLIFPDVDSGNGTRPVRLLFVVGEDRMDELPQLWELGGYQTTTLAGIGE